MTNSLNQCAFLLGPFNGKAAKVVMDAISYIGGGCRSVAEYRSCLSMFSLLSRVTSFKAPCVPSLVVAKSRLVFEVRFFPTVP